MLGILLILILVFYLSFFYPIFTPKEEPAEDKDSKYSKQMKKLWSIAQSSMRERKPLRAEKALLAILKFDEKNAAAYNRLGILYAKEQKFDEAIECFEIAQSLDNNASSLHNAGLIYLETGAFEKAAMAFEQAIKLEGDVPARYIALSKSYENLGKRKDAIEALENAYSLSPTTATLRQILSIHESAGDAEAVAATAARIEDQLAAEAKAREAKRRSAPRARSRLARPAVTRRSTRLTRKASRSASTITSQAPARSIRTARVSNTRRSVASARPQIPRSNNSSSPAPKPRPAKKPSNRRLVQ